MVNLIQLSYLWASLDMKGLERCERLPCCVADSCLNLPPPLPAQHSHTGISRLKYHHSSWLYSDQTHSEIATPVWGCPAEPIHISGAQW